jgi:hypothetical protein
VVWQANQSVRTGSRREDRIAGLPRGGRIAPDFVISAATFGRSGSSPVNGAGVQHRASSRRVDRAAVLANSLTGRFNGKFRKLFAWRGK